MSDTKEPEPTERNDGPDMAFMVQKLGEIGSNAGTLSIAHNERALGLLSRNRLVSLLITILSFIVGSSLFSSVVHNGTAVNPTAAQITLVTFGFSLAATVL